MAGYWKEVALWVGTFCIAAATITTTVIVVGTVMVWWITWLTETF